MSWLCDSTELVSGAWLTSAYVGHGVLAEDIPSTGVHGASVLYDQVALPGDAGKEIRGLILTQPSGLTSWAHGEDGTITAEGPDGVYTYTMQVYVDGEELGSPVTVTLSFGVGSITVGISGGSGGLSIGASAVPVVSINITGGLGALSVVAAGAALVSLSMSGRSGTLQVTAAGQVVVQPISAPPVGQRLQVANRRPVVQSIGRQPALQATRRPTYQGRTR